MSELKTPAEYLQDLITAIGRARKQHITHATFAHEFGLRRQFVYDIRDGHPRTWTLPEDERYKKIEELCQQHGITGFLEAAVAAQRAAPEQPERRIFSLSTGPLREFTRALQENDMIDDPQVAELWAKLVLRLSELERS